MSCGFLSHGPPIFDLLLCHSYSEWLACICQILVDLCYSSYTKVHLKNVIAFSDNTKDEGKMSGGVSERFISLQPGGFISLQPAGKTIHVGGA